MTEERSALSGVHGGTITASFTANSERPNGAGNLTIERISDMLSIACGRWGSCADYLRQTVQSLEASGIHDEYFRRLQELVADPLPNACKACEPIQSVLCLRRPSINHPIL